MQHKKIRTLVMACGLMAGSMMIGSTAMAGATPAMLSDTCAGCHGTNGISAGPAMPTIAGLPAEHTKLMMEEFASGDRPSTIMDRISKGYTAAEIDTIAKYFAGMKWENMSSHANSQMATAVDHKKGKSAKKAAKKCAKCHEDNGKLQEDDTPRLAGQWLDYLLIKAKDYKDSGMSVPQPKKMKKQVDKLSMEEMEALAHFYAGQK